MYNQEPETNDSFLPATHEEPDSFESDPFETPYEDPMVDYSFISL
jgi:hypothetical protein